MTRAPEEFRDKLVDYLYGELTGEERAAFEAHLESSEEGRRELAALQQTLQLARAGIRALDEAPPEHVKRSVLAFAAQHVSEKARTPWFAWLRNPGFVAAAGIATVALLAVFGKHSVLDPKPHLEAPAAPDRGAREVAPAPQSAPPARDERAPRDEPRQDLGAAPREREGAAPGALDELESPAPKAPAKRARSAGPAASGRRFAEPPPPRASAPASTTPTSPAANAVPAAELESAAESGSDQPVRTQRAVTGSGQPSTPQKAATESSRSDERSSGDHRYAPPPPAAPAAPAARAIGGLARERRPESMANAPDEAVELAHDHLRNGRLREAVRAYRQLLRDYPRDARASTWREQIEQSTRALNENAAKRAE